MHEPSGKEAWGRGPGLRWPFMIGPWTTSASSAKRWSALRPSRLSLGGVVSSWAWWHSWPRGLARNDTGSGAWVVTWMAAAAVSLGLALILMARKARAAGLTLLSGPGRKFAWNVTPPLAVGGLLTVALLRAGATELLPGHLAAALRDRCGDGRSFFGTHRAPDGPRVHGAWAPRPSLCPPALGNVFMAVGFGGLHIVFGAIIWRKHGG